MVKDGLVPGWFILDVACAHKARDLLVHLRGNPPHHDERMSGKINPYLARNMKQHNNNGYQDNLQFTLYSRSLCPRLVSQNPAKLRHH